jgi:hypothetical protein
MASLRSKAARELPEGSFDKLQAEAANLRASGKWPAALKAGEAAPDIQLPDRTGSTVRLNDLLGGGPVIVCFYRGDWCRFCRLHLQALAEITGEVCALLRVNSFSFPVGITPMSTPTVSPSRAEVQKAS